MKARCFRKTSFARCADTARRISSRSLLTDRRESGTVLRTDRVTCAAEGARRRACRGKNTEAFAKFRILLHHEDIKLQNFVTSVDKD